MKSDHQNNSVLVADDEKFNIIAMTHILSPEFNVHIAESGQAAIEAAIKHQPNVILLDVLMPGMDGFETLSVLKGTEETRAIPVIFITGLGSVENEEKGLSLGAADYINKPLRPAIVKLRIRHQIRMANQIDIMRRLSVTDSLTELHNRRHFDYRFRLEWERAKKEKTPISLILLNLDGFRSFNGRYGYALGDAALRTVSRAMERACAGPSDFAARWSGDEFALLLPGSDIGHAREIAQKLHADIAQTGFDVHAGPPASLTATLGVSACHPAQNQSINAFIADTDQALYAAKRAGGNRVGENGGGGAAGRP